MRFFQFLLVLIVFYGCSDTIEDNDQSMQGLYDDVVFRSNVASAFVNENGHLVIEASSTETIKLQVEAAQTGIYEISNDNNNKVTFNLNSKSYITEGENTGGSIEIEKITDSSVSGSFFFNARLNGTGEKLNFQKGVFFNIPFTNESSDNLVSKNFQAGLE